MLRMKHTKCVILAGGTGSRLGKLTTAVNKHLLPLGDKSVIAHQIEASLKIFNDLLIITSPEAISGISKIASAYPSRIYFAVQDKPLGIANALQLADDYCSSQSVFVLLADNIFTNMEQFRIAVDRSAHGASIWTKQVDNPSSYGVWYDTSKSIVEKPTDRLSKSAIVGAYLFDPMVFAYIKTLLPSHRGEYEITDVLKCYLHEKQLIVHPLLGDWLDIGESIESYNKIVKTFGAQNGIA